MHETLPDDTPLPLDALANREGAEKIRQASLRLPPAQRETLYLRQYLSFKEIAQMQGRPLGTVLSDFHRAVKKMQQWLSAEKEVTL